MVTLVHIVKNWFEPTHVEPKKFVIINRLAEEKVSVKIRFVQSTCGTLPAEQGIAFMPWYFKIKADREQLTEKLTEQN